MRVVRFGVGLGLGVAVVAFSGNAPAQTAPTASAKAAAPAPPPPPKAAPPGPGPAASAPAPAPSGPITVSAPDVVRLKNGGILRGTISELVPGEFVSIVLITGEARKVPYADVQFAGSANEAASAVPVARTPEAVRPPDAGIAAAAGAAPNTSSKARESQPFAVVHAEESLVSVTSKQQGMTLFRRAGSAEINGRYGATVSGYDEVCTAPCSVSMPAGTHTFGVAKPGSTPTRLLQSRSPPGK